MAAGTGAPSDALTFAARRLLQFNQPLAREFGPEMIMRNFTARTQITQQSCEEGWSAIGEWTGVQLSLVFEHVGILPQAPYVVYKSVDGWWDSIHMADALHPQTILAYGMNARHRPVQHGAPLRLRLERQLGDKSVKFLSRIIVTDRVDNIRDGTGSGSYADTLPHMSASIPLQSLLCDSSPSQPYC